MVSDFQEFSGISTGELVESHYYVITDVSQSTNEVILMILKLHFKKLLKSIYLVGLLVMHHEFFLTKKSNKELTKT